MKSGERLKCPACGREIPVPLDGGQNPVSPPREESTHSGKRRLFLPKAFSRIVVAVVVCGVLIFAAWRENSRHQIKQTGLVAPKLIQQVSPEISVGKASPSHASMSVCQLNDDANVNSDLTAGVLALTASKLRETNTVYVLDLANSMSTFARSTPRAPSCDLETCRKTGKLLGANKMLVGKIVRTNGIPTVEISIIDINAPTEKESCISRQVNEPLGRIIPKLAAELAGKMGETLSEEVRKKINAPIPLSDANIQVYGGGLNLILETKYADALKNLLRVKETSEPVTDVLYTIGRVYGMLKNTPQALEYYLKVSDMCRNNNSHQWLAEAQKALGDAYRDIKNDAEAIEAYKKAVTVARSRVPEELTARILYNLGYSYQATGSTKEMLGCYTESFDISKKQNSDFMAGYSALALAGYYKNTPEAGTWANLALYYFGLYNAQDMIPKARMIVGNTLLHGGDYQGAEKEYRESLDLAEKMDDKELMIKLNYILGTYLPEGKSGEREIGNLNAALKLAKPAKDCFMLSRIYTGLGQIYQSLKNPDEALKNLTNAVSEYAACSDVGNESKMLLNLASAYYDAGNFKSAIAACERGLQLLKQHPNRGLLFQFQLDLGTLKYSQGELSEAIRHFESALKNKQASPDKELTRSVYRSLVASYQKKGNIKKANRYAKELAALNTRSGIATVEGLDTLYERKTLLSPDNQDTILVKVRTSAGKTDDKTTPVRAELLEETISEISKIENVLVIDDSAKAGSEAGLKETGAVSAKTYINTSDELPADYTIEIQAVTKRGTAETSIHADCFGNKPADTLFTVSLTGLSSRELGKKFAAKLAAELAPYARKTISEFKAPQGPYSAQDWYYRGRFFRKKDNFAEAEIAFKAAIKASPDTLAYTRALGKLYVENKMFEKALEQCGKMEKIAARKGNLPGDLLETYNDYGRLYFLKTDYDKAGFYFRKVMGILEKNQFGTMELAANMANLGSVYGATKEYGKAIEILKESLAIAEKYGANSSAQMFARNIGITYSEKGDGDNADVYFSKAIELAEKTSKNNSFISDCFREKGLLKFTASKYDPAIQYFLKSLDLVKTSDDDPRKEALYMLLGMASSSMNNFTEALNYFNKALALREKMGGEENLAQIYYGIGVSKINLGEKTEALALMVKAVQIAKRLKNYPEEHRILFSLYEAYLLQGDSNKAKAALQDAAETAMSYSAEEAASDNKLLEKLGER